MEDRVRLMLPVGEKWTVGSSIAVEKAYITTSCLKKVFGGG